MSEVSKQSMQNVALSLSNLYKAINTLVDKHVLYQKVKKIYILRLKTRPWITAVIQNSIKTNNKVFENYISK